MELKKRPADLIARVGQGVRSSGKKLRKRLEMSWLSKKLRRFAAAKSKQYSRKNLYEFISDSAAMASGLEGRFLNIGAGGEVDSTLRSHGVDFISIDIDEKRGPDLVMDACDLAFEDNDFAAIFSIEVLEHIPTPHVAVSEMLRVLKPGGLVFLSTPFVFGIHDAPHDYFRYTRYGLQYLFRDFEIIRLEERNSYIEGLCVILLRLVMAEDKKSRNFGIASAVLLAVLSPVVFLARKLVPSRNVTTGYTLIARKR